MVLDCGDMNNLNMAIMSIQQDSERRNQGQNYNKSNKKQKSNQHLFGNNFDDQFFQDPMPDEDGFIGQFMKNQHNKKDMDFFGNDMALDDDNHLNNLSDHFGSQMIIMGGEDKIHQNFAGDTFSQISSTYEQQQQQQQQYQQNNNVNSGGNILHKGSNQFIQGSSNLGHQQSQGNENKSHIQSKLYQYQEKNRPQTKVKMHNDELLDSMILNNLDDDMNTQREQSLRGGGKQMQNNIERSNNHVFEFKSQKQSNKILGYPSSHSNLNNIIMNSEQLQQSDIQSTMTIYNSGIFDDASIMRILDKSISDDSLFILQQQQQIEELNSNISQNSNKLRNRFEVENSFIFECEDVKQILQNINAKYKEKLQKQRQNGVLQGGSLVGITFEELKSYEILASSAIEKLRQIQGIGKLILESQKVKSLSFKNYKQNLKIQIHNQIKKFKDICKKQYRQTENWKFKYQINEFEYNEKIQQLEERIDRQSDEINKLANRCELLKYEKDCMAKKNEQKLQDMEKILKTLIRNVSLQGDQDRLNKINNSFCIGNDHSMLLQPRSKSKLHLVKLNNNNNNDFQQQSVDDKENESILSNHAPKIDQKEIKNYLKRIQVLVKENRKFNQVHLKQDQLQQEQEGGSCFQSSQMLHYNQDFANEQQSQYIPEKTEQDINKAFIDNQNESQVSSSKSISYKPGDRMIDITEESIDYEFDQNQVLVVMNGKKEDEGIDQYQEDQEEIEQLKQSFNNFLDMQDKISSKDLQGLKNYDQSPSERHMLQYQREKMLQGKDRYQEENKMINFNDNSIDADLEILDNLQQNNLKNEINLSNEFSGFLNDDQFKKSMMFNGTGDGKNILVFDDFNGQGSDQMSRNLVGNLYSGGSSQLSMIHAFPNSNRIQIGNDVIIVKVLDRKIPIPKLNMHALHRREKIELFDKNIPDVEVTESSISQSEIQHTSISQVKNGGNIITDQNITSFQNESISKQYNSQVENTNSSMKGGEGLLDQAIYQDSQSKSNMSQGSHYQTKSNKPQNNNNANNAAGMMNMFDSFKQELGMLDSIKKIGPTNEQLQTNKKSNATLDLDESLERDNQIIFNNEFRQQFQNNNADNLDQKGDKIYHDTSMDKSLDLSVNVSKFKKSLSDPNLMFNDVDSDKEELEGRNQKVDKNQQQQKGQLNMLQNNVLLQNMKKLKTPQALQGKIKFTIPKNEGSQNQSINQSNIQPNKLNVRKTLSQFQSNLRSSIGNNSRQSHDDQITKLINNNSNTNTNSNQNTLSLYGKGGQVDGQEMFVNQSPQKKFKQTTNTNENIQRALMSTSAKVSESESPGIKSQETNSPLKKSQLIQNYIQGSASINGSQVSKQSITKIFNPNRKSCQRNVQNNTNLSQQEGIQMQNLSQNPKSQFYSKDFPVQDNIIDTSMMQEMKEHLESCDIQNQSKILRKKPVQNNFGSKGSIDEQDQQQQQVCLSPGQKRTSQSHTPKKRDMIIVNNQQIKLGQKIKIVKPSSSILSVDNHQSNDGDSQSVVRQSLPLKKITIQRKIINKKSQNISAIDQSIDQSQLVVPGLKSNNGNETFLNGHVDNSIMIHDISVIQPASIPKANIIKGLRKKSQITKINASSIINPNINISQIQNTSQLNISALNSSVMSKVNPGSLQLKNIVSALPNQNFISQQIIDKIKKQKIEKSEGQAQQANTSNYHSNPNPMNASHNDSQSKLLSRDGNSQSIEKLTKLPQRMMILNPAILQQQKIIQQQKSLQKHLNGQNDTIVNEPTAINQQNYQSVKNPTTNLINQSVINKQNDNSMINFTASNNSMIQYSNQQQPLMQANIRRIDENNKLQHRRREIIEKANNQQQQQQK